MRRRPDWVSRWVDALALALWAITFVALADLSAEAVAVEAAMLLLVAWLAVVSLWLARLLKWRVHGWHPLPEGRAPRAGWRHFGLLPLLALSMWGLVATDSPRRVVFVIHRPALEQFAREALSQKHDLSESNFNDNAPARRVGLYRVWRVEKVPGGVRFVTRHRSSAGDLYDGFVFYPDGAGSWLPKFPAESYHYARLEQRLDSRWLMWSGEVVISL